MIVVFYPEIPLSQGCELISELKEIMENNKNPAAHIQM